ncbi:RNA 2',3'-cyclic phosphodiesterase [Streptomyces daqingensis]|uniref:RNA 2',3'-cyclic phosphodiesterase n=1 Tax=Streptomyces daqingensis TaxID=1472640 RepID=A0ABQ2M358_9ACTN|nr:2'-5' RNA ligase family protein [Streptomyces daqingensis]GGO46137.1 RNA 2',3'-cyclic phosphodiesterase [Streptomyces daqingensis]
MRLFAALLPPADVLDGPGRLAEAVGQLHSMPGAGQLRWTDRANWHITLAFYGEVPDAVLPSLEERLARAAGRARPLRLRIAGAGRFGDRALWAGLDDGEDDGEEGDGSGGAPDHEGVAGRSSRGGTVAEARPGRARPGVRPVEAVRRLAAAAAAAGRRAGVELEDSRRFTPHLTVARPAKGTVDLRPYAAALGAFRGRSWTADELALVRSNLPDSGVPGEQPRYEKVAAWPLGG